MTNDRFREALRIDTSDLEKADTKEAMGTLMRVAGYHTKYDKELKRKVKLSPTQLQLDYAWKFIKKGQQFIDKIEYWKVYTVTNKRTGKEMIIRKAVKNVYIRGKLYKKGWFVPKKVRE